MNGNGNFLPGRVKFYDSRKGFGFIKPDDGSRDVFLSIKVLPKGCLVLTPDQAVKYVLGEGKNGKGPAAEELVLL
jgi:CspA family cold shock protein